MHNETIIVSVLNHIAMISLNRPEKRNAMNGEMIQALLSTIAKFADDDSVHVLMIQGEGEHFCAGADIQWMQSLAQVGEDENYEDAQILADLMYQLYSFPKPTIVLAHGTTLGGGLGLVSACDIAIAAKSASFGFSEVKIGIAPSVISPYAIAAIGERLAHYYFLTGERFGAEIAYRIHLVHQLAEDSALKSVALSVANTLLQNSLQAMKAAKQLIHYVAKEEITEVLAQKTAEHLANLRSGKDAQEGLKAFLEKRTPKWSMNTE